MSIINPEPPLSGVIMRFGSGEQADTVVYPGRKLTSVHPARRHEAMSYRIQSDGQGLHRTRPNGERWVHYRYTFTYRYMGRTIQIGWTCGDMYGNPQAIDGIRSAFRDAETVAWEAFTPSWAEDFGFDSDEREDMRRAEITYRACERMNARLDAFFTDAEEGERTRWEEATRER